MPEPAGALRLGDHVHYDGQSWQLVAVNGVWMTLRGSSMQSCAVLLTQLVSAPDFAVLDAAAPVPVVPAVLAALEPAELERLRRLEGHVRQIDAAVGDQDTAPDPRYDHRVTTVEQRVAAKAAELVGSDLAVGERQLFRWLAAYRSEGAIGLLASPRRRAVQGGDGLAGVDERVVAGLREPAGSSPSTPGPTRTPALGTAPNGGIWSPGSTPCCDLTTTNRGR